jgi:hypothetical protein
MPAPGTVPGGQHIRGHGTQCLNHSAPIRVRKPQTVAVQRLSGQQTSIIHKVLLLTHQGVAKPRHLHSNLVTAPRFEFEGHQRNFLCLFHHSEMRDRTHALARPHVAHAQVLPLLRQPA